MPAGPYPKEGPLKRMADAGCSKRSAAVLGTTPPPVQLNWSYTYPGSQMWDEGTRVALCLVNAKKGLLRHSVMPQ